MLAQKYSKAVVALAVALQATAVLGQCVGRHWPPGPASPLPPEFGFGHHHSSTALEGALRGRAQLTYASGAYCLALSQSLIGREEARQLALENSDRFVKGQRSRWAAWEADRQRRIASRRRRNETKRQITYEVYRLKPNQLDRVSGAVVWPTLLMKSEYDEVRLRLDAMFRDESQKSGSLTHRAAEVAELVRTLSDNLRRRQPEAEPAEYLATQKFLCGVKLEAVYPFGGVDGETKRTIASSPSSEREIAPWKSN